MRSPVRGRGVLRARRSSGGDVTKKKLHKGDEVSWRSHGSETHGEVEREITDREKAAGRTVDASPEAPQYEVRSARSGRSAVHRPDAVCMKSRCGRGPVRARHALPPSAVTVVALVV